MCCGVSNTDMRGAANYFMSCATVHIGMNTGALVVNEFP